MSRKPSGFTIVELLVVVAIIGVLVALLMPAVQSARESGRQATCQNSLKQIGTGVGQHISTLGRYPTGGWGSMWIGDPDQGNAQNQPGGWIYNLLPYIDQQTLHDAGAAGGGNTEGSQSYLYRQGGNVVRIMTALPGFNCPSRRRAVDYPLYNAASGTPTLPNMVTTGALATGYQPQFYTATSLTTLPAQPLTGTAKSDYAINSGDGSGGSLCEPTPGPPPTGSAASPSAPSNVANVLPGPFNEQLFQANTGVSYQQSMVLPGHITDGTNYTFLAGEKSLNPDHYTDGMANVGDRMNSYAGASFDISRTTNAAPLQDIPGYEPTCTICGGGAMSNFGTTPGIASSNSNFGSAHPNGVFFVMCDGSVRLIKYGINLALYQSLGNRIDQTQGNAPPIDDSMLK